MSIRISSGLRQAVLGAIPLKRSSVTITATTIAAVDGAADPDSLTDVGVKATGTITSNATNVSDADTITIDTKAYTFKTTLTPTEGEILIGGSAAISLDNLKSAINHTGTPDTDYKCAAAHPTVEGTTNTDTVQTLQALSAGTAGNSIALAKVAVTLTVSGATLTGGVNIGFLIAGFSPGDSILVEGFTGGAIGLRGPFEILTAAAGTITVPTASLADDAAGESVTITAILGGSFRNIMKDGIMRIYSGVIPANADAVETGTLLANITIANGAFTPGAPVNGLEFAAPSSGNIAKNADTWSGVGLVTGEAGYYRFYDNARVTGASATSKRFDGTCAEGSGGDLNMADLTVTEAATKEIDSFVITLPAY